MSQEPAEAAREGQAGAAGPVLGMLSRALELWVRQQCEAIEQLEIRLEGSAGQLLRGRLAGVRLQARQVRYQGLELAEVRLRSEPIQVRMGVLLRRRLLELEDAFRVRGSIRFSGEGLNRSLLSERWRQLGDDLAEELLGITPLAGVRIEQELLILEAAAAAEQRVEGAFHIQAREGTLALRRQAGESAEPAERSTLLPMDEAIRIERTQVGPSGLELEGQALVSPGPAGREPQ